MSWLLAATSSVCDHLPLAAANGSLVPWLTAVLGAVLGFVIRELYARRQDHRKFVALLGELLVELDEIKEQAERRVLGSSTVAGDIEPPLPVEAWALVLSTGKLERLAPDELGRLRALYSNVVAGNYLASHWVYFMQISRLSGDEHVWEAFEKEAARVMREPFVPIAKDIDDVIDDLEQIIEEGNKGVPRITRGFPA